MHTQKRYAAALAAIVYCTARLYMFDVFMFVLFLCLIRLLFVVGTALVYVVLEVRGHFTSAYRCTKVATVSASVGCGGGCGLSIKPRALGRAPAPATAAANRLSLL